MDRHFADTLQHTLGMLLGQADALVGVKDPDGRYVYANPALERILGIETGTLVGRRDEDFVPAERAAELRRQEAEVRAGARVCQEERFNVAGLSRAYMTVRYPYSDRDNVLVGTGFVAVDITHRLDMEHAVRGALEHAQAANERLQSALAELETRASVDSLTGAWNRARMEEAAKSELHRLQRYRHPVSLLFFDLDHFKAINDTHGHATGDRVLVEVVATVRRAYRASDVLARWGGEEFLVLAPNTGLDGATALAERLRAAVAGMTLQPPGPVTASFGVAECRASDTWESWVERADEAAYRAKRAGRNRVEACPPDPSGRIGVEHIAAGFVQLVWHPAYDSGNDRIDSQHRGLFQRANDLLHAVLDSRPSEELARVVDALLSDAACHFRDEEQIFREGAFPDADRHTAIHGALINIAQERVRAFRAGEAGVGELFQFLAGELIAGHMLSEDRRFFPYVRPATA